MACGAQVPEDLGDLTASARIEGEDLPVSRFGEMGVPGVVTGPQGAGVGPVAQFDRYAVQIADDEWMPYDQGLLLPCGQPRKNRLTSAGAARSGAGSCRPST